VPSVVIAVGCGCCEARVVTHDAPEHVHAPFWQVDAPEHPRPQPPQLALSVCSLTHELPHGLKPALQEMPHETPSHVDWPFAGTGQDTPQLEPQLLTDVLLMQVPPQLCVPAGHAQVPLWQVMPPLHALPHAPQLALSVDSLTQVPPHIVLPAMHAHAPLLQAPPAHVVVPDSYTQPCVSFEHVAKVFVFAHVVPTAWQTGSALHVHAAAPAAPVQLS
jgi:hypothetical protein